MGLGRLFLRVLRTRPHHWRPMLQVWITSNGHYTSENMSIFRVFPLLSIQWKPGPLGVLVLELFLGVLRTRPHHLWSTLQVWITSNDRNGFLGSLPSPTQRCSLFPTMLAWKKHQGFTWQELRDPSTRPYHFRAMLQVVDYKQSSSQVHTSPFGAFAHFHKDLHKDLACPNLKHWTLDQVRPNPFVRIPK